MMLHLRRISFIKIALHQEDKIVSSLSRLFFSPFCYSVDRAHRIHLHIPSFLCIFVFCFRLSFYCVHPNWRIWFGRSGACCMPKLTFVLIEFLRCEQWRQVGKAFACNRVFVFSFFYSRWARLFFRINEAAAVHWKWYSKRETKLHASVWHLSGSLIELHSDWMYF